MKKFLLSLLLAWNFGPVQAGVPVIDAANLSQNVLTALESVAHTLKQIEEYRTQLSQYENQLQNTLAPAAYVWDQAQETIASLQNATNTLEHYKNKLGGIDGYISKFQDVNYYKSAACFQRNGCTAEQRRLLEENSALSSEALKKAHDAMFKGIDQQQDNLHSDAAKLARLQNHAQSAEGQMQAIGYANQLASNQANQLLQIRSLLVAQQNALATRAQADADKEAKWEASAKRLREGKVNKSANVGFTLY